MGRFKSFDQFLDLFPSEPRQEIRNGYNVLCPAHDDHNPSLSATLNGCKILLHCKAGCPTPQILAKLNISASDLFFADSQTSMLEVTYQYHNESGQLLYEVLRYNPKSFKVRRPGSKDSWIWNLGVVRPVLYHLPDIIRAIANGDDIYVTEGEKDCDSLWALGLIATTNPFGAGKWREEYSESLVGANVVVVPHNDDQGRKHAINVIDSLEGKVKSLQVLDIPSTAKDVTGWLEQGHTVEDLLSLEKVTLNVYKNTYFYNGTQKQNLALNRDNFGTSSGQDEGKEWGFYAQKFDEFMQEANGRVDKREVAEAIGLKVTSDTFRKILSRRKSGDKPQVRAYRGSHNLIEWINRDYRITPEDIGTQATLEIRLPLNIPEYIKIPSRSVAAIAGYKSTGKTAFLLETAELNVYSQTLPVYYWYNEMGELLLNTRLEDYPLLPKARREGRFRPVMQTTFEFTDVIDPDAINLIDYIDRDDDIWLIGEDIRKIFTPLNKGCSIFALQKKRDSNLGYGGTPTLKLPTLYITLDEKYHSEEGTHGIAKIIVCKNWENINPVGLSCEYYTGGKHGKLFIDGEWRRC